MISSLSAKRGNRDARAFRFLLICISAWVAIRMMATWDVAFSDSPEPRFMPWAPPSRFSIAIEPPEAPVVLARHRLARSANMNAPQRLRPASSSASLANKKASTQLAGNSIADRHHLRFMLMVRSLQPAAQATAAFSEHRANWLPISPQAAAVPGRAEPFWMNRRLGGWSAGSWLYLRDGSGRAPDVLASASQLGGSQAGLRLAYGFGDAGRVRAYGRATIAVQRPQQREIAFGLAFAPLARLPVDVAIEQRVAAGREGRTALAVMASGGVSEVALPAGFRLDAYAQAGIVGTRRRDGFADGAIVVDRRLGPDETTPLRLGALAAGAVQPGAARVDVGPRLTLRLPQVGEGGRIALDWRQRIAGDARPESGLALTLAADF